MNTTNDKKEDDLEWGKWGKEGGTPPEMKKYFDILATHNTQAIKLLKKTKEEMEQKLKEYRGSN